MAGKKAGTKFTIQFSQTDPLHLQVAELLNQQGYHGKARYIVDAVLHYESCDATPDMQQPVWVDEKFIKAVVNRILHDRGECVVEESVSSVSAVKKQEPQQPIEEINFDEAMEALGENGFSAVASALDMFRRK